MSSCNLVISHNVLRKLIGWSGIFLPFILAIGNWISAGTSPPGSLSGYYYTDMRNFFVGGLCALGVFLLAYRGYERADGLITDVAGVSLVLVALCPTKPLERSLHHLTVRQDAVGDFHVVCAITALLALGVMALRFARAQQRFQIVIYRVCGIVIFCCVLLAAAASFVFESISSSPWQVLLCEVVAMLASGISWLVPGHAHGSSGVPDAMTPSVRAPALTDLPSLTVDSLRDGNVQVWRYRQATTDLRNRVEVPPNFG